MPADAMPVDAMRAAHVAEAMVTGCFLGLLQVALAFHLLVGSGASVLLVFALTAVWILGGAACATGIRVKVTGTWLLGFALLASLAARFALSRWPWSGAATAIAMAAGALTGGYGAAFLQDRSRRWGAVRSLLLHENNGFLLGIGGGSAVLLFSADVLDAIAIGLGFALFAWGAALERSR